MNGPNTIFITIPFYFPFRLLLPTKIGSLCQERVRPGKWTGTREEREQEKSSFQLELAFWKWPSRLESPSSSSSNSNSHGKVRRPWCYLGMEDSPWLLPTHHHHHRGQRPSKTCINTPIGPWLMRLRRCSCIKGWGWVPPTHTRNHPTKFHPPIINAGWRAINVLKKRLCLVCSLREWETQTMMKPCTTNPSKVELPHPQFGSIHKGTSLLLLPRPFQPCICWPKVSLQLSTWNNSAISESSRTNYELPRDERTNSPSNSCLAGRICCDTQPWIYGLTCQNASFLFHVYDLDGGFELA